MGDDCMTARDAVQSMDNPDELRMVEAVAAEKARNIELKRERERLMRRIAEEDARLAHA